MQQSSWRQDIADGASCGFVCSNMELDGYNSVFFILGVVYVFRCEICDSDNTFKVLFWLHIRKKNISFF